MTAVTESLVDAKDDTVRAELWAGDGVSCG